MKKKKVIILIACLALLLLGCESKQNSNEDSYSNVTKNEIVQENTPTHKNEEKDVGEKIAFETNYKIEEYCNGYFIVSKSDDLLYGVLDINGNEVIPVEYDRIEFLNQGAANNGSSKEVFFQTKYENDYKVYDQNGEKVLDGNASIITFELGSSQQDSPFFSVDSEQNTKEIYTKDGKHLCSIPKDENADVTAVHWITPNLYLMSETSTNIDGSTTIIQGFQTYLKNIDGTTLNTWNGMTPAGDDGCENNNYWCFLGTMDQTYSKIVISESGELVSQEDGLSQQDAIKDTTAAIYNTEKKYYLGSDKQYVLYQSNDTWKYEDANGNPVYDDRYFTMNEEENSFFLSNENNQVCVITKNGKRTVDYGVISLSGDYYTYEGTEMMRDNVFADYNSFCYVEQTAGTNIVHYFTSGT